MPLDPATCWVFIPISAIVLGIGSGIIAIISKTIQAYFQHTEQIAAIKAAKPAGLATDTAAEMQALRAEVARLRDTTTQYDLSIQHTLDEVQRRLSSLETTPSTYVPYSSEQRQVVKEETVPAGLQPER